MSWPRSFANAPSASRRPFRSGLEQHAFTAEDPDTVFIFEEKAVHLFAAGVGELLQRLAIPEKNLAIVSVCALGDEIDFIFSEAAKISELDRKTINISLHMKKPSSIPLSRWPRVIDFPEPLLFFSILHAQTISVGDCSPSPRLLTSHKLPTTATSINVPANLLHAIDLAMNYCPP